MKKKIVATEEMHLEKEWYEEAYKQSIKTLSKFAKHLFRDYSYDYGSAVHAVSAAALAATRVGASELGLTEFQASFVMWDFLQEWMHIGKEVGARIQDFDDMLYPQYRYKYEKTISKRTWENLQNAAKKKLKEVSDAHPDVIRHWQSIADGNVPFGYTVEEEEEI